MDSEAIAEQARDADTREANELKPWETLMEISKLTADLECLENAIKPLLEARDRIESATEELLAACDGNGDLQKAREEKSRSVGHMQAAVDNVLNMAKIVYGWKE